MRVASAFLSLLVPLAAGAAASGARAADWYTGAPRPAAASAPSVALDLSLSATTQNSMHGAVIGTIAPFGDFERSGMRTRLSSILGGYEYIATTAGVGRVTGSQVGGSFLAGYEWVARTATVAVWGGVDVMNTRLDKADPLNETQGMAVGFKAGVDFYVNPTPYTMISGNLSFSTANAAYFTRFKAGMAIAQGVYVGPELLMLGDNFYSQIRVGAHVTGFRIGPVQFGLAGGLVQDAVRGGGAYATFDTRVAF
jgi:hypothetical protein